VSDTAARPRLLPALFGIAAGLALAMGVESALHLRERSGGLLSVALPWVGVVFYAALAVTSRVRPGSPWLSRGVALLAFAHAMLICESVLEGRLCPGCLAVAAAAAVAAAIRVRSVSEDRLPVAASILLGAVAGFLSPFDRTDDALTRRLWPSRVYNLAPAFVDRQEMAGCPDGRPVRMIVFEKDCRG
jgi:hypothetical protein